MKASNLKMEGNLSFLLKGSPGFGKTIAACSFAKLGPVYLAYFDKNRPIELLTFFKRFRPDLLDNIEYDVYGSSNANEYLNKLYEFRNGCKYVAVITDSLTQLTASAVNWSIGFRDPKGPKKDKLSKSTQVMADWDEYKVETGLVTQAIDISRTLPCHIIWTAHPLPQTRVESAGASVKVSKSNSIVTYGSKVAGMIPGNFTEIYHFSKQTDWIDGQSKTKILVSTEAIGDDYAKTALNLPKEFDITDKLFYEEWRKLAIAGSEELDKIVAPGNNDFFGSSNNGEIVNNPSQPQKVNTDY